MLPKKELEALLGKLNGLYVPGDNKAILGNKDYAEAVKSALKFAKTENEMYESFPVVFTSWGLLALMKSVSGPAASNFETIDELYLTSRSVQQKVSHEDSFILNEASPLERNHLFEKVAQPFLVNKAMPVEAMEEQALR